LSLKAGKEEAKVNINNEKVNVEIIPKENQIV
jgi:hypothetical protein